MLIFFLTWLIFYLTAVKDKQSIGKMKVRENWDLLEEELEPSSMAHRLKVKGILKEDEEKNALKQTTRRGKVNILLKTLMNNEREDTIDKFIEALKGLGKSEIASQIQPKPDMHEEAGGFGDPIYMCYFYSLNNIGIRVVVTALIM